MVQESAGGPGPDSGDAEGGENQSYLGVEVNRTFVIN